MVLLVDEAQVEAHFGLFGDSANLDTREVLGLHQMYHTLRNHFGHTRWYYKVKRLKWKLVLVCLEIVLILTRERCTVCDESTIGSKILLDALDGTPR
jgi:hypothetical protein